MLTMQKSFVTEMVDTNYFSLNSYKHERYQSCALASRMSTTHAQKRLVNFSKNQQNTKRNPIRVSSHALRPSCPRSRLIQELKRAPNDIAHRQYHAAHLMR